jgi:hypothetical protein
MGQMRVFAESGRCERMTKIAIPINNGIKSCFVVLGVGMRFFGLNRKNKRSKIMVGMAKKTKTTGVGNPKP